MSTLDDQRQRSHTLSERLLLFLSRKPGTEDYEAGRDHWTVGDALSQLCRFFPNFLTSSVGKEILDLGCRTGYQSVALARAGAKYVVGLDINRAYLDKARELTRELGLTEQTKFTDRIEEGLRGGFDIVISQNSREHFPEPAQALDQMKSALKPNGNILITFGPPWFAPYSSHMHFLPRFPASTSCSRRKQS
jgi:2-polyprenyl-3-methyl-5-hydroxy-6-metoxy-1,4-benzoquinol methylase